MMDHLPPVGSVRTMTCSLSVQEWHAVLAGLNELPHRVARPVIDQLLPQLLMQEAQSVEERNNG